MRVISHLRNTLIVSVENLVKNCMHCPQCHNIYKKSILFKKFETFQFTDCTLVLMRHTWNFNRINNIHHRALRILYQNKKSSCKKLLQKDKSVSVHMKNLQYLATKIFKVKKRANLSLSIWKITVFSYRYL